MLHRLIQTLIAPTLLLITLQPLYGLQTDLEAFRRLELILRSERGNVPDATRYAASQWGQFLNNLAELEKVGAEDWSAQSDAVSGQQAERDLEERSKNLERVAGEIREFFQWYFNVPTPKIDSIPDEDLSDRLGRIASKVDDVLPLVIATVTRGAVLDVEEFPRMLQGLAEIEALSRALQN